MLTKQEEYKDLSNALGVKKLILKREDLHPYGSHKGRSIPKMIDLYISKGIKHFAISSSGNAALASAFYVTKLNAEIKSEEDKIKLNILIGQNINKKKLHKIEPFKSDYINITMHDRPLQTLFNILKDENIAGLRQSTDDNALTGYRELAEELDTINDLNAIFIGTSSGTTAQALAEYFISKNKKVEIHIVQTTSCNPISINYVDSAPEEISTADAIVDHVAIRKEKIIKLIDECNGSGWIATNEQIKSAQEMTKKYANLEISTNSALSIAGLMQAVYTSKEWDGTVVCMICGD